MLRKHEGIIIPDAQVDVGNARVETHYGGEHPNLKVVLASHWRDE